MILNLYLNFLNKKWIGFMDFVVMMVNLVIEVKSYDWWVDGLWVKMLVLCMCEGKKYIINGGGWREIMGLKFYEGNYVCVWKYYGDKV